MKPLQLLLDTWRGILSPRRLLPIAMVSIAMLLAEAWFTRTTEGVVEALLVCLYFLAFGPFTWRILFPPGQPAQLWRLALFVVLGGLAPFSAWVRPWLTAAPHTFLTAGVNGLVVADPFRAGAWGVGGDIAMEQQLQAEQARADQMTREMEQAQLMALRAHLDPHFLFNTLNAIAEWCREDGEVAERAVLQLSGLLREVMAGVQATRWPLARELKLVRDVWALYRIRDPERYAADFSLPQPLPEADLPPMLLLPLIENAVKHGPAAGHSGRMALSVQARGDRLLLTISNPGPFTGRRAGGAGLSMVDKRLELAYSGQGTLHIHTEEGRTVARLDVPRRLT